jgi:hypothetical protein
MTRKRLDPLLTTAVLGHLLITFAHGSAHRGAEVPLGVAGMAFVIVVIEAAPVVGLAISMFRARAGALVVATSMAASLVFGLVNHYIIPGPDHVAHVAAAWRPMFSTTALLLVLSEAIGVVAGTRIVRRMEEQP